MVQQIKDHFWETEARSEETKQFIGESKGGKNELIT